jgi:hypothetical protein
MNNTSNLSTERPSLFRRIWERIILWFRGTDKLENTIENEPRIVKIEFEAFEQFMSIKSTDIASIKKNLLQILARAGKQFQCDGERDGYTGLSPLPAKGMIQNYVRNIQHYLNALFEGEDLALTTQLNSQEKVFEQAKKEYDDQLSYYNKINEKSRQNYKYFSLFLGLLYTIFSLLLIAADIPLSMKVTQEVFLIEVPYEKWLMALGIALSAFYIKVFYDEYLSQSLENVVTKFKKQHLPGVDDHEISKVRLAWIVRFIIKLLICLFCITTIVILAYTRFNFFIHDSDLVGGLEASEKMIFEHWSVMLGFILISLLFPLMGGVLASLGFDKIQNFIAIRTAKKKCRNREKRFTEELKKYSEAVKQKDNCDSYLSWCKNESLFSQEYSDYFVSCYQYGYETGQLKRMEEDDLFTASERMRKRMFFVNIQELFSRKQNPLHPQLPPVLTEN